MAILLRMPEVSANLESAAIVAWTKAEGDPVAVGDCLAEIETDKAMIEFTAEAEGTLGQILVPAGKDAAVGAPMAVLLQGGEQDVDMEAMLQNQPAVDAAALTAAVAAAAPSAGLAAAPVASSIPASEMRARIFASPLARRLAAEASLPLRGVTGSGPHGRIVKRDVQATLADRPQVASAQPAVPAGRAPVPVTAESGDTLIPHSTMRRTIARRLLESKTTIPHFYLQAECRMSTLMTLRETINAGAPRRISINDILVKAVAAALAEKPAMNVSWTEEALVQRATTDISVAVSTDSGLITPVVRYVSGKSISVVSVEIAELANRARAGRLQPHEYQGGSFTISNLGMYGVQEFSAIINPPQSAILAVGAVEQRAVVGADGQIEAASVMTVTLSVDHRAIDGAVAAEWLRAFKRIVENPLVALI